MSDVPVEKIFHSKERKESEERNVVKLNPKEYKRHIKVRKILVDCVGSTSLALQNKIIKYDQFIKLQTEGAKLAVRSTNLFIAVRAWNEIVPMLLEIPSRKKDGVYIRFQPLADYFKPFGGYGLIVDEEYIEDAEVLEVVGATEGAVE